MVSVGSEKSIGFARRMDHLVWVENGKTRWNVYIYN